MHQLIKYGALAAELSSNELKAFCCKLIDDGEQELIMNGIFNNLYKQIKHNKDMSKIQNINKNIEEIIHQRNVINNHASNDSKPITINSLSSSSINEIGSYLWLDEIVKMERVNRRFFVSLRYPYPALQRIRSIYNIKHKINTSNWMTLYCNAQKEHQMPLDFQQFRSLSNITIDPRQVVQYEIDTLGRIFNKLNRLIIILRADNNNIKVLKSNICNFESVNNIKVSCLKYAPPLDSFSYFSYFEFLGISDPINAQLNGLGLHNIKCTDRVATIFNNMNMDTMHLQLLEVEIFRCATTTLALYKPILNKISSQILSLHIDDPNALINVKCDPNYVGFPKLKEFCFKGTRPSVSIAINELMKSVKNLKLVAIMFDKDTHRMNDLEKKNFSAAMRSILSINTLERIKLNVIPNDAAESEIIEIVEKAIMDGSINNEKRLVITIHTTNRLSSKVLLSFIKTMKIWRNNFSVKFGWTKPDTGKMKPINHKTKETLEKFANITYSSSKYMFYFEFSTLCKKKNVYQEKETCHHCGSYQSHVMG
eukprot:487628_1